jgi:hypothetical protein
MICLLICVNENLYDCPHDTDVDTKVALSQFRRYFIIL